jgi:pyruvate dehydrogenase E2 component (dihydrolipoamide acetyltransferase)
MAVEVTMPQMGADMTEGTLVKWTKQVGDHVERGDVLAEIETDKATVELEAYESGELIKVVVDEGEVVPVGQVIALIGEASEEAPDVERKPPADTPARRRVEPEQQPAAGGEARPDEQRPEAAETPPPHPQDLEKPVEEAPRVPAEQGGGEAEEQSDRGAEERRGRGAEAQRTRGAEEGAAGQEVAGEGRPRISPVARRIAADAGLNVEGLAGSGPGGRILRRDVEDAIANKKQQSAPAVTRQPAAPERAAAAPAPSAPEGLSRIRQAIARRMTASKQTQPHYYLTLDIDMTDALAFRQRLNAAASDEQRVSINDLIVKACAVALERHPRFNAEFGDNELRMHDKVNICIGVALDEGLIAPAIMDCGSKTLGRIARDAKDVVERAKGGHLTADEYSAGTFTITNLGAYGVETLIGIINPPQAAILGVGSVMARPAVIDDQVVVRQLMKVALSADHRVTDGAEGARFIKEIQGLLENPASLAL